MKVLLVTGSFPPDVCGTAEYTARLATGLNTVGVATEVLTGQPWRLANLAGLLRAVDRSGCDLVHLQYPTTGYGHLLGPQGIALARPLLVTMHEVSQSHVLRQLSLYPFFLRARHFIFTNGYELAHARRLAPWIGARSSVIPIGNNMPVAPFAAKRSGTVCCFGIIRPNKGLEAVIEAARLLHQQGCNVVFEVVGSLMPGRESYFASLQAASAGLPVQWKVGLPEEAVARHLAAASMAYLPFPDGASERRSSLIAMMQSRACILTTVGTHTPDEMKRCVIGVQSPAEAAGCIQRLLLQPEQAHSMGQLAGDYAQRFSWVHIAEQHRSIYRKYVA